MSSIVGLGLLVVGMEEAEASIVRDTKTGSTLVDKNQKTDSGAAAAAVDAAAAIDWKSILQKASKKALGGGRAGASAAVVQVCSLMWLRTSMNYQVRT